MPANLFTRTYGRPAVLAHRGSGPGLGASGHRENTYGALLWAVDAGADWLECDVQLSADGDLMLTHNVLFDGRAVRDMSTFELLQAGLDTLDHAHEHLPPHVGFDLDIKVSFFDRPGAEPDLFAAVRTWAERVREQRPVLLVSFCPTLSRRTSQVPVGWMVNATAWYYESVVSAVRMGADAVGVHADDVLDAPEGCPDAVEVAQFAREHDLAVLAWGTEPADVPELVRRGVTGLCGDDVQGLVAAVAVGA